MNACFLFLIYRGEVLNQGGSFLHCRDCTQKALRGRFHGRRGKGNAHFPGNGCRVGKRSALWGRFFAIAAWQKGAPPADCLLTGLPYSNARCAIMVVPGRDGRRARRTDWLRRWRDSHYQGWRSGSGRNCHRYTYLPSIRWRGTEGRPACQCGNLTEGRHSRQLQEPPNCHPLASK